MKSVTAELHRSATPKAPNFTFIPRLLHGQVNHVIPVENFIVWHGVYRNVVTLAAMLLLVLWQMEPSAWHILLVVKQTAGLHPMAPRAGRRRVSVTCWSIALGTLVTVRRM